MQLTPDLLLRAYALGIFPMAESRHDREVHWIDPELRGVMPLDRVHVPRRLRRRLKRGDFLVTANQAFGEVLRGCAAPAPGRPETWINETIEQLYGELHRMGFGHSIECWVQEGAEEAPRLVGGLYGIALGAAFFGESMFSREADASKAALIHLVLRLRKGGFQLLDTQFTTPHLRQFGAIDLPREHYKALLSRALMRSAAFPNDLSEEEVRSGLAALGTED